MSTYYSAYGAVDDDKIVPMRTVPSLGMTSERHYIDHQLTPPLGFR